MRRRTLGLLPLALAGCAAEAEARRGPQPSAGPLAGFHAALAALEAGRRQRVTVLQIGDSHTANDGFSTRMRQELQQRYGAAGRGILPPGVPFRLYNPDQVRVTQEGWAPVSSFGGDAAGPFGITGLRQRAARRGAEMVLASDLPGALAQVQLEVLRRPGGGTLEVRAEGHPLRLVHTRSVFTDALFVPLPGGPEVREISIRARGDGPVDLLSWVAHRRDRGVAYCNLGTIGATVELIGRWDEKTLRTELAMLDPALLLIAFGTNEAFGEPPDAGYGARFTQRVRRLAALAPQASVLVMGPPDGNTRAGGSGGGCAPDADRPGDAAWTVPRNLPLVREAQRRAAAATGWAFFDWSDPMGGPCGMHDWTQREPQLALADHVHLRTAGYRITAEPLLRMLLDGAPRGRTVTAASVGAVPSLAPGAVPNFAPGAVPATR